MIHKFKCEMNVEGVAPSKAFSAQQRILQNMSFTKIENAHDTKVAFSSPVSTVYLATKNGLPFWLGLFYESPSNKS